MRRSLEAKLLIQHYAHWVQLLLDPARQTCKEEVGRKAICRSQSETTQRRHGHRTHSTALPDLVSYPDPTHKRERVWSLSSDFWGFWVEKFDHQSGAHT